MKKPPKPKTLVEVFTEEGLFDDPDVVVVCDCHRLTHCPTAWMNPRKDNNGSKKRMAVLECQAHGRR